MGNCKNVSGVIKLHCGAGPRINEYMAPEVIERAANTAYVMQRTDGTYELGGIRAFRFLESKGLLSFISAPVNFT